MAITNRVRIRVEDLEYKVSVQELVKNDTTLKQRPTSGSYSVERGSSGGRRIRTNKLGSVMTKFNGFDGSVSRDMRIDEYAEVWGAVKEFNQRKYNVDSYIIVEYSVMTTIKVKENRHNLDPGSVVFNVTEYSKTGVRKEHTVPLPNVYSEGRICEGGAISIPGNRTFIEQASYLNNSFFNTSFNGDLSTFDEEDWTMNYTQLDFPSEMIEQRAEELGVETLYIRELLDDIVNRTRRANAERYLKAASIMDIDYSFFVSPH